MDEQEILEQDLLVSEATPEADVLLGTIDVINVANDDAIIDIDDAFSALGEPNEQLNHSLLNGRDAADQHPITAITGLRAELDSIECMKRNLQANGRRYAQYYRWYDTNPVRANRDGYFVSLVEGTNYIKICDGTSEDVFGVIIPAPSTAFIGGVAEELVDQYGLVCFTGDVNVIRYEDVATGDCVLPNQSGIAHKSNCSGYKVIAVGNDGGTLYATINLGENGKFLSSLRSELDTIATNILNNQQSATTGINNANADIATIDTQVKSLEGSLESAQNELIALTEMVNGAYENAQNALNNAIVAQNYATASANAAIAAKNQAVAQANNAVSSVNQLAADLSPISNWEDEATGNIGAEYFVEHIQNDLGTKTEILTASTKAENALTAVSKNAKMLQSLASITKKYVVGPQSQGYGLKLSELQSTLVEGSIYVTTATHSEAYGDGYTQNFISGKSYRWSGTTWDEFKDVYMINVYRTGDTNHPLWYNTATNSITADEVVYDPETLYLWHDDIWVAVATLQESSLARVTSMIKQTADSISAEIVNARGSYASMSARLTADEAVVSQSAIWIDNNSEAIATTIQKASDNEAEIAQLTSIQTLDVVTTKRIGDTPTGTFYAQQPTWDDANQSWKFSGDASTTPSSPCYAKKSDGDKLYYHYFSIVENGETVWYRNEIGPVSYSRAGIINRVNAAESTLDSLTTWQGTTDESITNIEQTSRKDEAYINHIAAVKHYDAVSVEELSEVPTGTFYTNPPAWNANTEKWVFSGAGSTTPTSSCYGQKAANATTYYKYSKATVNDSDVWYRDEIGETSSSIAGIQQKVDDQGASIGMVVSKTESGKVINRAGIVAAINGNSNTSYVEVEADEVNFNGKTIAMSASNDLTITAGNGFRLDKNGIFWTIESNPTKMVYSQVLVAKPVDGTQYSSFPTSSASTWHKTVTALDKYASETTDSGTTWGAIRQIVGEDGTNGTSIIFKGSYPSAPSDPQNGWSYYNTTAKASYVYQGGSWYQMSIDGVNGQNGTNGISIVWKGESSTPPSNPATNWVYRNTDDSKVYIYNGTGWELMVLDGSDGQDGANGTDGNSVFITYNNNAADNAPSTPTGDGTSGGWHTNATSASVWMSQKVSSSASSGTWGTPVRIKGTDGSNGKDGASISISSTSITYQASSSGTTTPTGTWQNTVPSLSNGQYLWTKTVVNYSDSTTTTSYSVSYKGTNGADGTSSYTHIRYSANSDGTSFVDTPTSATIYIGIYNGTSSTAPTSKTSYIWSKYHGDNGGKGDPGNGINSITYYYARTTTQTAPNAASITSTTIPTLDATNKYLWQKEVIDFTDSGVADMTTVSLIAIYGDTGSQGISVTGVIEQYCAHSSSTTAPSSGWSETIPALTSSNPYMWRRQKVTYSSGNPTYTTAYLDTYIDIITGKSTDGVMTSLNNVIEYKSGDGYVLKRAGVVTAINGATAETNTKISADKIDLTGYVTISSLGSGGTTTIDGSRITTGSISASRIDASNLRVSAANIDGTLTIGQLPSTVAETSDIPTSVSDLTNDSGYQTSSGVTTIIGNTVTTGFVEALGITVSAAKVTGTLTIGQLPNTIAQKSEIPTDVSDLNNDTGFITNSDLGSSGTTTIDGARITTGAIQSSNYEAGVTGSKLSLSDGSFDSKNFKVTSTGNITATGGTIGNWAVNNNTISAGNGSVVLYGGPSSSSAGENQYKSLVDNSYSTGRIMSGMPSSTTHITGSNMIGFFDIANGVYTFVDNYDDGVFVSNNNDEDDPTAYNDSTACVKLTAKQDMKVKFDWSCSSEENHDIFSIQIGEQSYSYSGINKTGSIDYVDIASGDKIVFSYKKDSRRSDGTDQCSFYNMYVLCDPKFRVLDDGSLYASNAKIGGNIDANEGHIGGWNISEYGLSSSSSGSRCELTTADSSGQSYGSLIFYDENGNQRSRYGESAEVANIQSTNIGASHMNANTADINWCGIGTYYMQRICFTPRPGQETTCAYVTNNAATTTMTLRKDATGNPNVIYTLNQALNYVYNLTFYVRSFVGNDVKELTYSIPAGSTTGQIACSTGWFWGIGDCGFDTNWTKTKTVPVSNNGTVSWHFSVDVYDKNSTIITSDRNVKKDILPYTEQYDAFFDNLKPVKYKFIENQSDRTHSGYISQDVNDALIAAGLTSQDFAGYIKYKDDDGNDAYALRYEEFISLNTWQIQKLKKQVAEMQEEIRKLKGENHELDSSNE